MKERNITVTLEQAKKWLNSGNLTLKVLALQAFSEDELKSDFMKITTFKDACEILYYDYNAVSSIINDDLLRFSKASAAMFKLNIIRKALNLGQDLHLTENRKDERLYYPCNPFITKDSTYYKDELDLGKMERIGMIKSEGVLYSVLGDCASFYGDTGLGSFYHGSNVGFADANPGFLGCATKEIAEHFSKYFGMLITEAKYADMVDFQIIEDKYGNTK